MGIKFDSPLVLSPENNAGNVVNNLFGKPIWIGRNLEGMLSKESYAYFACSIPKILSKDDHFKIYLWKKKVGPPLKIIQEKKTKEPKEIKKDVVPTVVGKSHLKDLSSQVEMRK